MSCTQNGYTIPNDENGSLARSVNYVAGTDSQKEIILASYISSQDFINYCLNSDSVKQQSVQTKKPVKSLSEINVNRFRKLLNDYFKKEHLSVLNTVAQRQVDSLGGFSNQMAKREAIDHCATEIIKIYYNNLAAPVEKRKSYDQIIKILVKNLTNTLYDSYVNPLVEEFLSTGTTEQQSDASELKRLNSEIDDLITKAKAKESESRKDRKNKALYNEWKSMTKEIDAKRSEKYAAAKNFINKYGNSRQKNYLALVAQAKGDTAKWFSQVFQSSKLVAIEKEFDEILESDKLENDNFEDEADYVNADNDSSVDESSKSWENKLYASFEKNVNIKLRLYFDTLVQWSAPYNPSEPNERYLDTNSELGIAKTIGAKYVINQLVTMCDFSSVNAFIDSLLEVSRKIPSMYGFAQIYIDMLNNPGMFNNPRYIFSQLADKLTKKMILVYDENADGIFRSHFDMVQGNINSSKFAQMLLVMYSSACNSYRNEIDIHDKDIATKYISDIAGFKTENEFVNEQRYQTPDGEYLPTSREEYDDFIRKIFRKYFPTIDFNMVLSCLYDNNGGVLERYKEIITGIGILLDVSEEVNSKYQEQFAGYLSNLKVYKEELATRTLIGEDISTLRKPIFSGENLPFNKFYQSIIRMAQTLAPYSAATTELNSMNAEGNLASDLLGRNYLNNFFDQINFSTKEDAMAGLKILGERIKNIEQYRYSPIFFGVKDRNGRTIKPGLFERTPDGEIVVTEKAKSLLNYSLFDGARLADRSKGEMYDGMSKGDYFITKLIAFQHPDRFESIDETNKTAIRDEYCGILMRTPSDAPKNFIIQVPRYHLHGSYKNGTLNLFSMPDITDFVEEKKREINSRFAINNPEYADLYNEVMFSEKNNFKDVSAEELYDILMNGSEPITYNRLFAINRPDGKVIIPVQYSYEVGRETESVTVYLEGDRVPGRIDEVAENLKVIAIHTDGFSKELPDKFYEEIKRTRLEDEAIKKHKVEFGTNTNNEIFLGLKTHLLNELNTFISQLNNVFEYKNGRWVTKSSAKGLIELAHYKGEIVKDGKLTGNFFNFLKFFKTKGYSVNDAMHELLSLYGGDDALFKKNRNGGLTLNTKRNDIIRIEDRRISLTISNDLNSKLDEIVSNWVLNFREEILERLEQYDPLIIAAYCTTEDVIETSLNDVIYYMSFDDIFEGDSKFYKSAQDFLKRAKEVPAHGKSYTGYDYSERFDWPVHEIRGYKGEPEKITINGREIKLPRRDGNRMTERVLTARNGFRAVTITNTVRPSRYRDEIKERVYNSIRAKDSTLTEEQAMKIAAQTAAGFGYNSGDLTIANDAQSYITFEEWIARRYADGTLLEYTDLIEQILDVREGKKTIKDLNLEEINARIQVQKNFYYDLKYDDDLRTMYPRQIKNAEFVLIPELLEGTQLKDLYDIMIRNDIGQINTTEASKAAKKNVLTFWDNDGNINENFENDINENNQTAVEDFYYRYLYKQQDVQEHMKDEQNKAGTQLTKKILDNASPAVRKYAEAFFRNYCANIKEDFKRLVHEMGWKIKEDGSLDMNNLSFDEFWKKARHEAQRLGLDSNVIDYLTPEFIGGNPSMPNFMNNFSSKMESIAMSIFNRDVTRQTLPGWHAAQITSVGIGSKTLDSNGKLRELKYHPTVYTDALTDQKVDMTDEQYKELSDEDKKKYNVKEEAYAEVLIPRWSNLIPKDYDISKLESEGLDIQIAYRIPTEGKQSVSVVKVVGFLDDVYGSTIVVPDEWVTQTGSDFDVDTVYGIAPELYVDKNGDVKKVKYDNDLSHEGYRRRYINYVNSYLRDRVKRDVTYDEINEEKKRISDTIYKSLHEDYLDDVENTGIGELIRKCNELINNSSPELKKQMDLVLKQFPSKSQKGERYNAFANIASELKSDEIADVATAIAKIFDSIDNMHERFISDFRKFKYEKYAEMYEIIEEDYLRRVQEAAEKDGLLSFDEFKELDVEDQQSRRARNNAILDAMVSIMSDPTSIEENFARSNFDDIKAEKKRLEKLAGIDAGSASPYNPFDQVDFMDNAMSGARLKAFSVTRDTFNSICNYTHARLSPEHFITIEYDLSKYDADLIAKTFDYVDFKSHPGYAVVRHNRLANSKNNRNVVGRLLTAYSSETTAHILDAIKTGAIINENEFTFGTFKTLVDVGSDYDTAIAFLMQPAVTRINECYNEKKSLFISGNGNNINNAIKRIVKDIVGNINGDEISDFTSMEKIWDVIDNNPRIVAVFKQLVGDNWDSRKTAHEQTFPINGKFLEARLEKKENTVEQLAFDIAMCLAFQKVNRTTKNIEAIARCVNSDKFGAKQTIFETRMKLADIAAYSAVEKNPVGNTITVGAKNMLSAIYPGFENGVVDYKNSAYPFIAAFLNNVTIPSTEVFSELFKLEDAEYSAVADIVQVSLGMRFNSTQYKEYKQYIVNSVYNSTESLLVPWTISKEGFIITDTELAKEYADNNTFYWDMERARVYGYIEDSYVYIEDVNNPTEDEIRQFARLSPAQKALFIQTEFPENRGIFDFLTTDLFNNYEYRKQGFSKQIIRYSAMNAEVESVYDAFNNSYFNKNPLIRLATADLIKYAFVVEGFKFTYRGVSKYVPNDTMNASRREMGLGVIDDIVTNFNAYSNPAEIASKNFVTKYVRSHSNMVRQVNINYSRDVNKNKLYFQLRNCTQNDGIIVIPNNSTKSELLEALTEWNGMPIEYVRIRKGIGKGKYETTLYKIRSGAKGTYLYPLNLLDANETCDYSANPNNNKFLAEEYYNAVIDNALNSGKTINEISKDKATLSEYGIDKDGYRIEKQRINQNISTVTDMNAINRLLVVQKGTSLATLEKFVEDIEAYAKTPLSEDLQFGVIRNNSPFIMSLVPKRTSVIQNITTKDGDSILVKLSRYKASRGFRAKLINKYAKEPHLKEENTALERCISGKDKYPILFRVDIVTEEQVKEEQEKKRKDYDDYIAGELSAITSDIEDIERVYDTKLSPSDKVAKELFNAITVQSRLGKVKKQNDTSAEKFLKSMSLRGLDSNSNASITENRNSIYSSAEQYYTEKAHAISETLNLFVNEKGDLILHEYLEEHPDELQNVLRVILDAKTFGEAFGDVMQLPVTGEDDITAKAIQNLQKVISEVRNNIIVNKAIKFIFNDWLANNYSNNPLVKRGLIDLTTQFGDTDWWDKCFSDIGELNNKQIQAIVKYVYSIIDAARMTTAPKAVKKFTSEYDRIMAMPGNFEWRHILDENSRLVRPYKDSFLKDKQEQIDKLNAVKEKYGEDSIEYHKAKLERDKWFLKYTNQPLLDTYYEEEIALREEVLKSAPKEYVEYKRLQRELYSKSISTDYYNDEEVARRKKINDEISRLLSNLNEDYSEKDIDIQERVYHLNNYLKSVSKLNKQWFDYNPTEVFKKSLAYHLKVIERYDRKHPDETLPEKLKDEAYKNAYDWIHANSRYKLDAESAKAIHDAFKVLQSEDNNGNEFVRGVLERAGAYDRYGHIDARKLKPSDIELLKNHAESKFKYNYDNNNGDGMLIKATPDNLPVFSDEFYKAIESKEERNSDVERTRRKCIAAINNILKKCVGLNGRLDISAIFDGKTLTEEELINLSELYRILGNIKSGRSKEDIEKLREHVDFKTNDKAYNEAWSYLQTNLKGTKYEDFWISICVQHDRNGIVLDEDGNFVPNRDLFGYIMPKDDTFIDQEKTAARNLIHNELEFVPTEYYYAAREEAEKNGTFMEWFKANHVYNQYTHKYEPLKVWTEMRVKPGGRFDGKYEYVPVGDNVERTVKEGLDNDNYEIGGDNYKFDLEIETGKDMNPYSARNALTKKEFEMMKLLSATMDEFSSTYAMKKFAKQGFLPRRYREKANKEWAGRQVLESLGFAGRQTGESNWTENVSYANRFDPRFSMMEILKTKGYKEVPERPKKGTLMTDEEYSKMLEQWKSEKEKIEAENLKLEREIIDDDWRSVFQDFIEKAVEYQAKQQASNMVFLGLEWLKDNPAYALHRVTGNPITNKKMSTNESDEYVTTNQSNAFDLYQNWARRVLYNQYKKDNRFKDLADMLQNFTSAKYMMLNVTGGVANVTTGLAGIVMESFAKDYFNHSELMSAQQMYLGNAFAMLKDMYSETSDNKAVAFSKLFNIVDFDEFMERRPNETVVQWVKRTRNALYGLQSGGEHYMQNTVLFAMLKSNRIFKDEKGKYVCGSLAQYNWKLERDVLWNLLSKRDGMLLAYKQFLVEAKRDLSQLRKYDNFSQDINMNFLKDINDPKLTEDYIAARKKALETAEKEFKEFPTMEDQFELIDGKMAVKADSPVTAEMLGLFKNSVISVNKKIHGVYDKLGAAKIESEFWGGMVMQYHKHIYPGIMKRWRTNGYYNELRGSIERGSYVCLADFLATEFKETNRNLKKRRANEEEITMLESIQSYFKACIDTVLNIKTNWNLMPEWERRNIKRNLGDLYYTGACLLAAMCIYMMTDDDDLEENEFLATALYISDRMLGEAQLYTPWGLITEGKTQWSNPIAAKSAPEDLLSCIGYIAQWMYDPEFDINYKTGLYAGQNKIEVKLYRNTPIYRVYKRLSAMTRNNSYYKINESGLNMKFAKSIADEIVPD